VLITVNYRVFEKHLGLSESAEIDAFPKPSVIQAKKIIKNMNVNFSSKQTLDWITINLPMIKAYVKCCRVYPELML
jgi:hypothetical protein